MEEVQLHVGIDDTDSREGGCTTYTAAIVYDELCRIGLVPLDFPWLVRLNPNIPWKTRGNGALALHFRCQEGELSDAKEVVLRIVEANTDVSAPSTDPAVVFLPDTTNPDLREFSDRALHDVIRIVDANNLVTKIGVEAYTPSGRRGIIGALAAVGYDMNRDHTFEVIAYRTEKNRGTPRRVDLDSVRSVDSKYGDLTFNNVDPETGRVLVCPHGPDPVLFGIRGENPRALLDVFSEVVVHEPVERVMLFKTNHGTDAHLSVEREIASLRPFEAAVVTGTVSSRPTVLRGGHVIFKIRGESGLLYCAAYEPTGSLHRVARELIPGDAVRVSGGIRIGPMKQLTLNIERLEIVGLAEDVQLKKPRCSRCDRRCEAMGRGQGFRCRKCGKRFSRDSIMREVRRRAIQLGAYQSPPRAHRHLTKPTSRFGRQVPPSSSTEIQNESSFNFIDAEMVPLLAGLASNTRPLSNVQP